MTLWPITLILAGTSVQGRTADYAAGGKETRHVHRVEEQEIGRGGGDDPLP